MLELKPPQRPAVIAALAIAVGLLAALISVFEVGLFPPRLELKKVETGVAVTHVLVAGTAAEVGGMPPDVDALELSTDVDHVVDRAAMAAEVISSRAVLDRLGPAIGADPARIAASTRITRSVPRSLVEPGFERRAAQIRDARAPYQLELQARPGEPVIDLYARAPSAAQAERFADAVVAAADSYLRSLARRRGIDPGQRIGLTQLGPARGGSLDSAVPLKLAGLSFVVFSAIAGGLLVLTLRLFRSLRGIRPVTVTGSAPGGDWPRTTRILPWAVALFLALIWLVPFNAIALEGSFPVDLNLDRPLLAGIVALWALALLVGGPAAPRLRPGPLHLAVGVFAAVAFLSVVLNAGELNRTLGLDLAIKKLALLVSYVSLFVVVASVVRRREVRPFLVLTLGLAVICSIGVLWEYRYGYNVFYDLSGRLLSGVFSVQPAPSGFDELGRRAGSGPTDHGLELVAILSMALPIALVGVMESQRLRTRVLHGLAACVVGAAVISTYRKSAFVAPAVVLLTLAVLWPRRLPRLAPLALVALVALPLVSFSAFQSISDQFESDRLSASTVGDRVTDYGAIRADFLSRPALGLGFGSYENATEPSEARILDSDLLLRLIDTGVLGLGAFLAMVAATVVVAARLARRGGWRAPPALAIAAAAAAFGVLAALFDEWSFPHAPYLFLTLAGIAAVLAEREHEPPSADAEPRPAGLRAGGREEPERVPAQVGTPV